MASMVARDVADPSGDRAIEHQVDRAPGTAQRFAGSGQLFAKRRDRLGRVGRKIAAENGPGEGAIVLLDLLHGDRKVRQEAVCPGFDGGSRPAQHRLLQRYLEPGIQCRRLARLVAVFGRAANVGDGGKDGTFDDRPEQDVCREAFRRFGQQALQLAGGKPLARTARPKPRAIDDQAVASGAGLEKDQCLPVSGHDPGAGIGERRQGLIDLGCVAKGRGKHRRLPPLERRMGRVEHDDPERRQQLGQCATAGVLQRRAVAVVAGQPGHGRVPGGAGRKRRRKQRQSFPGAGQLLAVHRELRCIDGAFGETPADQAAITIDPPRDAGFAEVVVVAREPEDRHDGPLPRVFESRRQRARGERLVHGVERPRQQAGLLPGGDGECAGRSQSRQLLVASGCGKRRRVELGGPCPGAWRHGRGTGNRHRLDPDQASPL